ncbi:sensor histidine kinase [Natranaerovirga hydrolytica]|uniref:sensor histidine kinase n=1 Tax=Natranaerovirga hydrolytica TaxID=680378 RepID=UPI001FAAC274|nr:histidine kinase [Natranaerovirga hydrolytica]
MRWNIKGNNEVGVVLLLFLILLSIARWRFAMPTWTVLMDQGVCMVALFFYEDALYGLVFPVFETMLLLNPLFLIPTLIILIIENTYHTLGLLVLIQIALLGTVIGIWKKQRNVYIKEADEERGNRYELERLKGELLMANVKVAKMAEISERNRIARNLHDHVGHEMTAATLALKAFEKMWKEDHPKANEMFDLAQKRISDSMIQLRETIYDISPVQVMGVDTLKGICDQIKHLQITFKYYGDTSFIPVYIWSVLEPVLKEALTNVEKHSNGDQVDVSLDVTSNLVRLSVKDNGTHSQESKAVGMGLRNLKQRAQGVGGNISTDMNQGFRLVCVLPIK